MLAAIVPTITPVGDILTKWSVHREHTVTAADIDDSSAVGGAVLAVDQ